MSILVRRLEQEDAGDLFRLRREAVQKEPFAFVASREDDVASSEEAVRERLSSPDSPVFGAFDDQKLIGMLGLARERRKKEAHKACIWGAFVREDYRKRGAGAQLLQAAIAHARTMEGLASIWLGVSERTPNAQRLYELAGFEVWGIEPDCIRVDGESARLYHLSLSLK